MRYVQDPDTGELIPADQYVPKRAMNPHHLIIGDRHYDGLQATDGADISSRAKHKAYMKQHGLTTMDDYAGTWAKAQAKRDEYRIKGGTIRHEDVARAIHQLQSDRNRTDR